MVTSPLNAVPVFFCQTPVPPHESHGPSKMTPILIISFIPAPRLQYGACSQNFPAVAAAAMGPVVGKKAHVPYGCRPFVFFAWTLWPHPHPRNWVNSPPFLILHLCPSPCHVNFPPCPKKFLPAHPAAMYPSRKNVGTSPMIAVPAVGWLTPISLYLFSLLLISLFRGLGDVFPL